MIQRDPLPDALIEAHLPSFEVWKGKATAMTQSACLAKGKGHTFSSEVYGALKPALLAHFSNKCAYCESRFDHVAFGDVEHYRPKKRVDEDDAAGHPGYFWLAYNPSNLLPACQICNTREKRCRFPIAGTRVSDPQDDLDQEQPLLLNPYVPQDFLRPQDEVSAEPGTILAAVSVHLAFVFEIDDDDLTPTGVVRASTDRGEKSIEVYGLNRTPLVEHRKRLQFNAFAMLENKFFKQSYKKMIEDLSDDSQDCAAAVRSAIAAWRWLQRSRI